MPIGIIGPTLGVAQLAATLSGVPYATGSVMIVQMIHASCSQITVHKQKFAQLDQRCTSLLNCINEHSSLLVGTDLPVTAAFDEAEAVLLSVHCRVQKWADCGKFKGILRSAQIVHDLDKCYADVNHAMERLHIANLASMLCMQQRSIDMMKQHQADMAETLQQSPRKFEQTIQQHISGGNEAYELMHLDQEVNKTNINPTSVRGGTYSQIFEDHRLGEKKIIFLARLPFLFANLAVSTNTAWKFFLLNLLL